MSKRVWLYDKWSVDKRRNLMQKRSDLYDRLHFGDLSNSHDKLKYFEILNRLRLSNNYLTSRMKRDYPDIGSPGIGPLRIIR